MKLLHSIYLFLHKVSRVVFRICKNNLLSLRYCFFPYNLTPTKEQFSNFSIKIPTNNIDVEVKKYLLSKYLNHQFNVLGSGWKTLNIKDLTIDKNGQWLCEILKKNHLKYSKSIWKEIIKTKADYKPIAWQKDIKTDFSFDVKKISSKQKNITPKNVDIKNPWEIARLQHLPQMALFALNEKEEIQVEILKEFKCQTLDFILANPLGMGVNWECTMEVGIRIANILLAFDWFKQLDTHNILNIEFHNILLRSTLEHAHYIYHHFEYKKNLTANHYLGNIAGLSFIASYLNSSKKTNQWLALCVQEIAAETQLQFLPDGGNFEGSTSYHRLSAELIAYSTAILQKCIEQNPNRLKKVYPYFRFFEPFLKKQNIQNLRNNLFFAKNHYQNLYQIAHFIDCYTKPNGNIAQIGDNDSGRFLKLSPIGNFLSSIEVKAKYQNISSNENIYWDENDINHSATLSLLNAFFDKKIQFTTHLHLLAEYSIAKQLIANPLLHFQRKQNNFPQRTIDSFQSLQHKKEKTFHFPNENLLENICLEHFEDFGLIVFKSKTLFLTIYYGANEKAQSSWGHQHNDKLSFELAVNGKDIVSDPGSYCYTSNPKLRNQFRSTKVHSTICINNEEQNPFPKGIVGLFNYIKRTQTKLLYLSKEKIILSNRYAKYKHYRIFELQTNNIKITDYCNSPFTQNFESKWHSNGYGKLLNSLSTTL